MRLSTESQKCVYIRVSQIAFSCMASRRKHLCLLVIPSSSLPVHAAETCNHNAHSHLGLFLLFGSLLLCATTTATSSSRRLLVRRACNDTHDLCVSHLEVAGAIGGGLCANLRVAAAELVPAPAIYAEECEVVGGCVERHLCVALSRKTQRISNTVLEGPIGGGNKIKGLCVVLGGPSGTSRR